MRPALYVAFVALFSAGGCKKKQPPPTPVSQAPVVSPAPNPTPPRPAPKVVAPSGTDWRKMPAHPDAGETRRVGAAPAVDAGAAAAELAQAKKDTEGAADKAMAGVNAKLKSCFDMAKIDRVSVTVAFDVRQSGYVSGAKVKGAPAGLARCIEGVVNAMKVAGAKAAVSISRTFNYKKK